MTALAFPFSITLRAISLLLSSLLLSLLLHLLSSVRVTGVSKRRDNLLDGIDSARRAAWLGKNDLAGLVDDKDAALGALGRLLKPDRGDEGRVRVAEERVGQPLLLLEGRVGLGRVGREAVDGQTARRQGLVRVAEEAGLGGALDVD
jgi:hypothetical protein